MNGKANLFGRSSESLRRTLRERDKITGTHNRFVEGKLDGLMNRLKTELSEVKVDATSQSHPTLDKRSVLAKCGKGKRPSIEKKGSNLKGFVISCGCCPEVSCEADRDWACVFRWNRLNQFNGLMPSDIPIYDVADISKSLNERLLSAKLRSTKLAAIKDVILMNKELGRAAPFVINIDPFEMYRWNKLALEIMQHQLAEESLNKTSGR